MKGFARWAVGLAAGLMLVGTAVAQRGTSLAFERAEHLRKGINLSTWYAQTRDFTPQRIPTRRRRTSRSSKAWGSTTFG